MSFRDEQNFRHRYSRQINLESVGLEGQRRLQQARVLIVGVGGLGAPVGLYLAAAGVGTLGLIDPDGVEESNLQRQVLFSQADQGMAKVEAAAIRLQSMNPDLQVQTYHDYFAANNAESLASNYDLIIDGSDNFSTKYLIADVAHKLGKPMVYGAAEQLEGQVGIFHSQRGSCYRCYFPEKPRASIRNCNEAGIMGALVGVVGSLQASLALHWIIAHGDSHHDLFPPLGRIMLINLQSLDSYQFQVKKRTDCPTCSKPPQRVELQFDLSQCSAADEIVWSEAKVMEKLGRAVFVDVREDAEWQQFSIPGSIHWPLSKIRQGQPITEFESHSIILVCQRGQRSLEALRLLRASGSQEIYSLKGGIDSFLLSMESQRTTVL